MIKSSVAGQFIACGILMICLGAINIPASAQLTEDFESFEFGLLDGQQGWTSTSTFSMVDFSGEDGFGSLSLRHQFEIFDTSFEIRSPQFETPYGKGVFMDVVVNGDKGFEIKPWDLGGGIQNTILTLNDDGSMSAFQLSDGGTFTGVTVATAGHWFPNKKTRLGFVVFDDNTLQIWQDGDIIFQGDDMAQDYPFGGPDTGIGQLRIENSGQASGFASWFFIDHISAFNISIPTSFEIHRGMLIDGTQIQLRNSDDEYVVLQPGITLNANEAPISLTFFDNLPPQLPTELFVKVESSSDTFGIQQTVEMYNFLEDEFEVVGVDSVSIGNDQIMTIDISDGISNYVTPASASIQSRISWKASGPIFVFPWSIRLDQVAYDFQ